MRRLIAFSCEGDTLVGTVDEASGATGILIVSGGSEIRCGAHRGMALLAAQLALEGVPVFRFDRRGVGDSEGADGGWATSAPDMAAALAAFRREQPQLASVVGFGNCDAATALVLLDRGCDALVLANPWLGDDAAPHPRAALRDHYARQLRDPGAWRRLLTGGIGRVAGIVAALLRRRQEQPLAARVATTLARRPTTVVLAKGDRTARVFADAVTLPAGAKAVTIDAASHSFAGAGDDLVRLLLDAVSSCRIARFG